MAKSRLFAKSYLVEYIDVYFDNEDMRKNARLPKVLGNRVQKARKKMGLTQEELADKIGVRRVYMGYVEQGRNTPSLETLQKLARALGVSLGSLID